MKKRMDNPIETGVNGQGVSIITCTNKPLMIDNVFANYRSQAWPVKELIIILNKDEMNPDEWKRRANGDPNVFIFQLPEQLSLGECCNFAVDQTKYDYIATFDDDDYYAPLYLHDMMPVFHQTAADIVGKKTHYLYLENLKDLYLRFPGQENRYVDWVCGGKKIVKRHVFNHVRYQHISTSEDIYFCLECLKHGFTIYSTDRFNLIYKRCADTMSHTWKITDEDVVKNDCEFIAHTEDYKSFSKRPV
ncbi:glycosyltransferase [Brevibacillus borstelensis]|uniref:glycosyltransferase n=1 Tax=Brevibacillus borstelensis TaxID=45462 RepID=UPI0030C4BF68